jgi:hypothetical protein
MKVVLHVPGRGTGLGGNGNEMPTQRRLIVASLDDLPSGLPQGTVVEVKSR